MNARRRAHFEKLLLAERSRITGTLGRLEAPAPAGAAENGRRPPGLERDAGTAGVSPEDDAAIATRETAALAEVDGALRRLYEDPERYGLCAMCGRPISSKRLEIVPAARRCERHALVTPS